MLTAPTVERWLRPFTRRQHTLNDTFGGPRPPGIVELAVRVRAGGAGRVATLFVDGNEMVTVPFLVRHDRDRASARLAELLASTEREFGPRGRAAVEAYGTELFDTIFPMPALGVYRQSLDAALEANGRLRIVLDLDDMTQDLPWEYLFDAHRSQFLAMSGDTSVSRRIDTAHSTRRSAPVETLRVLVMATNPRTTAPLRAQAEIDRIETQLAAVAGVELRAVDGQTFEDLRLARRDFDPHVVYLIGHGRWDETADDGAILFADRHGNPSPVSGRDLGVLLNRPGLRLVLCNSCDGARTSTADPFAGVTDSLVAQGVPAAIGMQYPIENRAAASFGVAFLTALASRAPIDDALSEARAAVYAAGNGVEWATPVLTMRVPVDDVITWRPDGPSQPPMATSTSLTA